MLRGVTPAVWRLIDVPNLTPLDELHDVLQYTFGWTNSYKHGYVARTGVYRPAADLDDGDLNEWGVPATSLPSPFSYLYGGDWLIDVEIVGPGLDYAGCIDGQGSCPPEYGPFDIEAIDRTIRAMTDHSHG